jgi:MarR family
MTSDRLPDRAAIEHELLSAGLTSVYHWDVLVFLYRHPTSLVSAEHIARLLGYGTAEVVAALEHLEALGWVSRSRVSQAVRLYQFTVPAEATPSDAGHRLLRLADSRPVRLLLAKRWRHGAGRPNPNARAASGVGLVGENAWQKAS